MRTVKQIAVEGDRLFALADDGTMWTRQRSADIAGWDAKESGDWAFIEGPPEGRPDYQEPTLEEQAEKLRSQGGSQTFAGRGHHLSGKPGEKT